MIENNSKKTDLTKQISKAGETLNGSEELYRQLFNRSPIGIVLINLKGIIIDFNPKLVEIAGYKREELKGRRYIELGLFATEELSKSAEIFDE